jgi:hemoglobin-like flavoprotein
MTPKQIELVQSTWQRVVAIEDQAATLFYERLFATDPSLRGLFKSDLTLQKRALMKMIGVAVSALDRLDTIVPAVRELGRRHHSYGVKAAHYGTVAGALLATLEQGLGSIFTAEVKEAWTAAYTVLASTMQQGATAR